MDRGKDSTRPDQTGQDKKRRKTGKREREETVRTRRSALVPSSFLPILCLSVCVCVRFGVGLIFEYGRSTTGGSWQEEESQYFDVNNNDDDGDNTAAARAAAARAAASRVRASKIKKRIAR